MGIFAKKKLPEQTILLLDIESGSVGAALAVLSTGKQPKVFAEKRILLPAVYHQGGASLFPKIVKAAREALVHSSEVAARLRNNQTTAPLGVVSSTAIFMGAPWGVPNLAKGSSQFVPALQQVLREEVSNFIDEPLFFYTGADAVASGMSRLQPGKTLLVCIIRGEVSELLLIGKGGVRGYATLPTGINTLKRTLMSHDSASDAEIATMVQLAAEDNSLVYEPLEASSRHFVEEFAGATESLLASEQDATTDVLIVAPDRLGAWFAKSLATDQSLIWHFPQGGVVRSLGSTHFRDHVAANETFADIHLLLGTLFVDGKHRGVY